LPHQKEAWEQLQNIGSTFWSRWRLLFTTILRANFRLCFNNTIISTHIRVTKTDNKIRRSYCIIKYKSKQFKIIIKKRGTQAILPEIPLLSNKLSWKFSNTSMLRHVSKLFFG